MTGVSPARSASQSARSALVTQREFDASQEKTLNPAIALMGYVATVFCYQTRHSERQVVVCS